MRALLTVVALSLLAAPASAEETSLRDFIFSKLDYDLQYFEKVQRMHNKGKRDTKLSATDWDREVKRAAGNVPVLRSFFEEKSGYLAGKTFSLPPRGEAHRVYTNLIAILNMMQTYEANNYEEALRFGGRVKIDDRENLGVTTGKSADYYLQLYREYFYLMAAANYRLSKDAEAVRWFARIQADADIKKLQEELAAEDERKDEGETKADILERLAVRPMAVLPPVQRGRDEAHGWLGRGLMEVITADLVQYTEMVIVERSQLDKVIEEIGLAQLGVTDEKTAAKVGEMLKAGSLLSGTYSVEGDDAALAYRLVADNGKTLLSVEDTVHVDDVFQGARDLVLRLLSDAGWMDSFSAADLRAAHAPATNTVRDLLEARLLKATKSADARELYERAVKEDPAYATLFDDLKSEFADVSASLAVMPFLNIIGSEEDAWMLRGIAEALATDLPKMQFTVVERSQLARVIEQEALGQMLGDDIARDLAVKVGADFMVVGSLMRQGEHLRVDVRFVEVRTGVIMFSTTVETREGDFMGLLSTLSMEIAARFNADLTDEQKAELAGRKMNPADFEKFMRQELAKDALATAERAQERQVLATADGPSRTLFWSAVGAAVAGTALAATGFIMSDRHADEAAFSHALAQVSTTRAESDRHESDSNGSAGSANGWGAVGWIGVGVAALSIGYVVYDELTAADGATEVKGPVVSAGPTDGGVVLGLSGSF